MPQWSPHTRPCCPPCSTCRRPSHWSVPSMRFRASSPVSPFGIRHESDGENTGWEFHSKFSLTRKLTLRHCLPVTPFFSRFPHYEYSELSQNHHRIKMVVLAKQKLTQRNKASDITSTMLPLTSVANILHTCVPDKR